MKKKWQKNSWRDLSISQQPTYSDKGLLKLVEDKIEKLPPLVFAGEVRSLKEKLKKVALGEASYFRVETAQRAFLTLVQIT